MRSFAVVITTMPVAENSMQREVLGRFEALAPQVRDRQQEREQPSRPATTMPRKTREAVDAHHPRAWS